MYKNKKIGLALSGGGYRGAAHIGALKALEELDIEPDIISGTSAGSVVGTLYAAGHHWKTIYKFFKGIEILSFKNYSFQKAGLLDSYKFISLFKEVLPKDDFSSLKKPMFISATDLLDAKTQYFYEGELIRPLLASCAIPGIFSPIPFGNTLLCDGGVINNLPTEPILPICDIIIGINLSPLQNKNLEDLKSTRKVMERAFAIIRKTQSVKNFNDCDILISPKNLSHYNILSKNRLDEIFESGYSETIKKLTKYIEENNF